MSGHHPPNIPEQGVRGAGLPPEEPMETQMPTQMTFSIPMGHTDQFTPLQQFPYNYHMQAPIMQAHQMRQHMPMGYYTPYLVTHMPPGMQAGPSSDKEEYQLSPTLRLGAGNKRL